MPAFAAAVPMSMKKPMRQLADEIMGDHRSMLVRAVTSPTPAQCRPFRVSVSQWSCLAGAAGGVPTGGATRLGVWAHGRQPCTAPEGSWCRQEATERRVREECSESQNREWYGIPVADKCSESERGGAVA